MASESSQTAGSRQSDQEVEATLRFDFHNAVHDAMETIAASPALARKSAHLLSRGQLEELEPRLLQLREQLQRELGVAARACPCTSAG
jgi:polyhydroxyalkanoate synthesis regulator phasin